MNVGDRVRIHRPGFKDSTGHEYDPGRFHGMAATITECMLSHCFCVEFDEPTTTPWDVVLDDEVILVDER